MTADCMNSSFGLSTLSVKRSGGCSGMQGQIQLFAHITSSTRDLFLAGAGWRLHYLLVEFVATEGMNKAYASVQRGGGYRTKVQTDGGRKKTRGSFGQFGGLA